MDDLIGFLVGIFVFIFVVVPFAIYVVGLIVTGIVWAWINLLVLFDSVLGSFPFPYPVLSWAFNGFVIGSVLNFAFNESFRVNNPAAQPLALLALCAYWGFALMSGV